MKRVLLFFLFIAGVTTAGFSQKTKVIFESTPSINRNGWSFGIGYGYEAVFRGQLRLGRRFGLELGVGFGYRRIRVRWFDDTAIGPDRGFFLANDLLLRFPADLRYILSYDAEAPVRLTILLGYDLAGTTYRKVRMQRDGVEGKEEYEHFDYPLWIHAIRAGFELSFPLQNEHRITIGPGFSSQIGRHPILPVMLGIRFRLEFSDLSGQKRHDQAGQHRKTSLNRRAQDQSLPGISQADLR